MAEKYLSTGKAAKYLGVSLSTMYRMVDRGEFDPIKTPGGQRRFSTEELDAYKEKSRSIVAPQKPYLEKEGMAEKLAARKAGKISGESFMEQLQNATDLYKQLSKCQTEADFYALAQSHGVGDSFEAFMGDTQTALALSDDDLDGLNAAGDDNDPSIINLLKNTFLE